MEIDEELEKIKKQMLNKILSSDTPSGVLKGGEVVNLNLNNFLYSKHLIQPCSH